MSQLPNEYRQIYTRTSCEIDGDHLVIKIPNEKLTHIEEFLNHEQIDYEILPVDELDHAVGHKPSTTKIRCSIPESNDDDILHDLTPCQIFMGRMETFVRRRYGDQN